MKNTRVKIFNGGIQELEKRVNKLLNNNNVEVLGVDFTSSQASEKWSNGHFAVLVWYRDVGEGE